MKTMNRRPAAVYLFSVALALLMGACAAAPRPESGRPRANAPGYPVVLAAANDRRERALAAWAALARDNGVNGSVTTPAPELQPVTATIRALPSPASPSALLLQLPKVEAIGGGKETTEEATREALRRFISNASALVGVEARDVSLVARTDEADGTKTARYEQRPFSYPLRGGYGILQIDFTTGGRVTGLSSTAIPDAQRIARQLANVQTRVTAQQATAGVIGHAVSYRDANGKDQTYTITAADEIAPRQLVVYPLKPAADANALEFHVAWEISVGRGTNSAGNIPRAVYLDAVTGEIIGADV